VQPNRHVTVGLHDVIDVRKDHVSARDRRDLSERASAVTPKLGSALELPGENRLLSRTVQRTDNRAGIASRQPDELTINAGHRVDGRSAEREAGVRLRLLIRLGIGEAGRNALRSPVTGSDVVLIREVAVLAEQREERHAVVEHVVNLLLRPNLLQ